MKNNSVSSIVTFVQKNINPNLHDRTKKFFPKLPLSIGTKSERYRLPDISGDCPGGEG